MGQSMDRALNEPGLLVEPLVDLGGIERVKTRISVLGIARNPGSVAFMEDVKKLFLEWKGMNHNKGSLEFDIGYEYLCADPGEQVLFIRKLSKFIADCISGVSPETSDYGASYGGGVYRLAIDMFQHRYLVYSPDNMELSKYSPESVCAKTPPDIVKEMRIDALPCKIVFEPRTIDTAWEEDITEAGHTQRLTLFNLFKAPAYRFLKAPIPESLEEIDPDLEKYFYTFSQSSAETRHVLLSWAKLCLLDKADTILVLVGQGGTGKSFFARLLRGLVGEDYFKHGQNKFFETQFTSGLQENRCVFIDEGNMDTEAKVSHAKKYVERSYSEEKKGVDAKPAVINASLIFATNYLNALCLKPEERKFTVPDAGDWRQEWGTIAEWNAFEKRMLTDEKLILLYNFLEAYETDWEPTTSYRGARFWEIVVAGGLTDKERLVYDRLLELKEPIPIRQFVATCNRDLKGSRSIVTSKNVMRLLNSFKQGGKPIGELETSPEGEQYIKNYEQGEHEIDDQDEDFDLDFGGLDVL